MEAIWVAAEMRAGGAFAHSTLAINAMDRRRPSTHRLRARNDEHQQF